jgi:hypothetical protein
LDGVRESKAALRAILARLDAATEAATAEGVSAIERQAKLELSRAAHPRGTPTPSAPGEPPAAITGTLRRSMRSTTARRVGFGSYSAQVGPTVVYARAQELGIDRQVTVRAHRRQGATVREHAVHLRLPPRPSLEPGVATAKPQLSRIYARRWANAIKG